MTLISDLFPNANGKIVSFFTSNPDKDYSYNEVKKATKLSLRQMYRVIPYLIDNGILEQTRIVGKKTCMFKLKSDVKTEQLIKFQKELQNKEDVKR